MWHALNFCIFLWQFPISYFSFTVVRSVLKQLRDTGLLISWRRAMLKAHLFALARISSKITYKLPSIRLQGLSRG